MYREIRQLSREECIQAIHDTWAVVFLELLSDRKMKEMIVDFTRYMTEQENFPSEAYECICLGMCF